MAKDYFQTEEFKELLKYYERHRGIDKKSIYLDDDEFVDLADYYLSNDTPDAAMEAVEMGLDIHRDSETLLTMKSAIYIYQFRFKKADDMLAGLDKSDPEVMYQLAQLQFAYHNDIPKAEKMWHKWLQIESGIDDDVEYKRENYLHIISTIAVMRNPQNEEEKQVLAETLKRWIREYIDTFQPLGKSDCDIQVVDICRENELVDLLCEALTQVLEERPYLPKGWSTLALAHYTRAEAEQALEACAFALAINPDDLDALLTRAYTYYELCDDKQRAKDAFREYLVKGGDAMQILPYAETLFNNGEREEALRQLTQLERRLESKEKKLERRIETASNAKGENCWQAREKYNAFIEQYRTVLHDVADIYYRNKCYKRSIKTLRRYSAIGGSEFYTFFMLGLNRIALKKDLLYAKLAFNISLGYAEDSVMAGLDIAMIYIMNDYDDWALEMFERVDKIAEKSDSPFVKNIPVAKSLLYIKNGDMEKFLTCFKTACEETPDLVKSVYGYNFPADMPVSEWYDYAQRETQALQKKFNEEGANFGGF